MPISSLVIRMIMCSAQTQVLPYLATENELLAQTMEAHTFIYGGAGFILQCTNILWRCSVSATLPPR